MSDLHAAGGIGAVLRELEPLLHLDCMTVTGETLGERLAAAPAWVDRGVVRRLGGAVSAARRTGRAVRHARAERRDHQALGRGSERCSSARDARSCSNRSTTSPRASMRRTSTSTPDDFLVLKNAGPEEWLCDARGRLPADPRRSSPRQGVKDMVRISDARMSGTAFGTIVLHVSPEAAAGGPLALVRNGDRIRLSVAERKLDLLVDDAELAQARAPRTGRRNRIRHAATRGSTCKACCRPSTAATSISCVTRRTDPHDPNQRSAVPRRHAVQRRPEPRRRALRAALPLARCEQRRARRVRHELRGELARRRRTDGAAREARRRAASIRPA